jgi:Caspase domain
MRRAIPLILALSALIWPSSAFAAKRLALVIGIDAYDNLPALQKAVNDEKAVAAALTGLGFRRGLGRKPHPTRDEREARRARPKDRARRHRVLLFRRTWGGARGRELSSAARSSETA